METSKKSRVFDDILKIDKHANTQRK